MEVLESLERVSRSLEESLELYERAVLDVSLVEKS